MDTPLSRDTLLVALDWSPTGMFIVDNGRLVGGNAAFAQYTGFGQDELAGMDQWALVHPDDRARVRQAHAAMLRGERHEPAVFRARARGGSWHHVQTLIGRLPRMGPRALIGACMDVTEQWETQYRDLELLYLMARALVEPGSFEERAKRLADTILTELGVAYVRLFLPDPSGEGIRLTAWAVEPNVHTVRPETFRAWGENTSAVAFAQQRTIVINEDYTHRTVGGRARSWVAGIKSGAWMPCIVGDSCRGVLAIGAREEGFFTSPRMRALQAVAQGVGSLIERADMLNALEMKEEVEHRLRAFISVASHELRGPAATIHGCADLLLAGDVPPEQQREWLATIHRESQVLASLLDNLLDLSRIRAGAEPLNIQVAAVSDLIHSVVETWRARMQERGHTIEAIVANDTPPLWADPDKIRQVLNNLVENAVKYSPASGTVTIAAAPQESHGVLISVTDQGIGIPADEQEQIFSAFHRARHPATRSVKGSGLELSIVKELVELMGGTIWVESTVGHGSTFFVALPAHRHGTGASQQQTTS